jgi:predicted N-acetyltransferase YhbS
MTTILLRQANNADVPRIVEVIRAGFEEYRGRLDPPSGAHDETIETIQRKMQNASAVVALADEKIVGCVLVEIENDHIYLGRLAVLPEFRKQGIARKLMAWAETRAHALGFTRVQLGVRLALPENLAYFQKLGYRISKYEHHSGFAEPTFATLEKEVSSQNAYSI